MASVDSHVTAAGTLLRLLSSNDGTLNRSANKVKILNDLAKELKAMKDSHSIRCIRPMNALKCLRCLMASANVAVRAATLRVLRYLMVSTELLEGVYQFRLDLLIVGSLDHDASAEFETERLQAIKLMRVMLLLKPSAFSLACCRSLVAVAEATNDSHHRAALAILCELATLNPGLICSCGGIRTLLSATVTIQIPLLNEILVQTLTRLMNFPETRVALRHSLDLEVITAPLLDADYKHSVESADGTTEQAMNERLEHLNASHMALIWMMRTWPGLIYLCRADETNAITALISSLPFPNENVQFAIMDIVYHSLHIRIPLDTPDFDLALESIAYSAVQENWTLDHGWLVEEARCTLPPYRFNKCNFIQQYHALVLRAFIDRGLVDKLCEVTLSANAMVQVHAVILLGEIQHMAAQLLPNEFSLQVHSLIPIVSTAADPEMDVTKRQRANAVMAQLERIHRLRNSPVVPTSPYLTQLIQHTPEVSDLKMKVPSSIITDLDDATLLGMIKAATGGNTDLEKWIWPKVSLVLRTQGVTFRRLEELSPKFIRCLAYFYQPKSLLFSALPCTVENVSLYSRIGVQLVQFLLSGITDESQKYLMDILQEILQLLQELLQSDDVAPPVGNPFTEHKVAKTLSRDYFLLLGKLSSTRPGIAMLEKMNAFKIMMDLCDLHDRPDVQRLILSSLEYSYDSHARIILAKLLTGTSKEVRQYATRHMRVYCRAGVPFFRSCMIELLIGQLYDIDPDIALDALDVLSEACNDESCLKTLISFQPALLHLGPKGRSLFLRFLSVHSGFQLLKTMNFVVPELESWFTRECKAYVVSAETQLLQVLSTFKPQPEGHYSRCSSDSDDDQFAPHALQLLLPIHLYGELAQQRDGLALLVNTGHLQHFVEKLKMGDIDTHENLEEAKAAVWALCHVGSSTIGVDVLQREEALPPIIRLAESCPIFSLRGTCVLALSLVARRPEGCDLLEELGWASTRQSPTGRHLTTTTLIEEPVEDLIDDDDMQEEEDVFTFLEDDSFPPRAGPVQTLPSRPKSIRTQMEDRRSHSSSMSPITAGRMQRSTSLVSATFSTSSQPGTAVRRKASMPYIFSGLSTSSKSPVPSRPQSPYVLPSSCPTSHMTRRLSRFSLAADSSRDISSLVSGPTSGNLGSSSSRFGIAAGHSYIGVSLPSDIRRIFACKRFDYSFSIPNQQQNEVFAKGLMVDNLHMPQNCLKCCIRPSSNIKSTEEEAEQSTTQGTYGKVTTDPTSFNDTSSAARSLFRKEMVKLVVKLSCPVGSRATQQALLGMKDECPSMFREMCLYNQVADILATYHYRLHVRVFLQGMFDVAGSLK